MKLLDYSILFTIFSLVLLLPISIAEQEILTYSRYEMQYHGRMDNAIDDGLFSMVERDDVQTVVINREEYVKNFYESFFGNFGIADDEYAKQRMRKHLPFIGIVEQNRVSFFYQNPVKINETVEFLDTWTDYIPYEYEEGGYRYHFSVGSGKDMIVIYLPSKGEWIEGTRWELAKQDTELLWLTKDEVFEQIRRNTVISVLKREMERVVKENSLLAKQYGLEYEVYLPEVEKQDWCRTLDDIGMIVLFQGYPIKATVGKTYTRFVYSGARTYKR